MLILGVCDVSNFEIRLYPYKDLWFLVGECKSYEHLCGTKEEYLEAIRSATSITDSTCTASVKVSTNTPLIIIVIIRYYNSISPRPLEVLLEILVAVLATTSTILHSSCEGAAVGIHDEEVLLEVRSWNLSLWEQDSVVIIIN